MDDLLNDTEPAIEFDDLEPFKTKSKKFFPQRPEPKPKKKKV